MSYKDIPDCFQPLSIANNKYTFTDGVYSLERDRLLEAGDSSQDPGGTTATASLTLVANDDTATGQAPPNYLNGIRRVRNIMVDMDYSVHISNSANVYVRWILDVVVLRQGQSQVFTNEVLASRGGITRSATQSGTGLYQLFDEEDISVCYPGYVDLNGGDQIIVRLSMVGSNSFRYFLGLDGSCCVRFG